MNSIDRDFPLILMFRRLAKMERTINSIAQALAGPSEDSENPDEEQAEESILKKALERKIGDITPSHNLTSERVGLSIEPID